MLVEEVVGAMAPTTSKCTFRPDITICSSARSNRSDAIYSIPIDSKSKLIEQMIRLFNLSLHVSLVTWGEGHSRLHLLDHTAVLLKL